MLQDFCSKIYPWPHSLNFLYHVQQNDNKIKYFKTVSKMTLKRTQAIACIALLLDDDSEQENVPPRKKRLIWVKPWLRKRVEQGIFNNLFQELLVGDSTSFRDYIRMDRLHFDYLVERLYPYLVKEDTVMRESIKPAEQCKSIIGIPISG